MFELILNDKTAQAYMIFFMGKNVPPVQFTRMPLKNKTIIT